MLVAHQPIQPYTARPAARRTRHDRCPPLATHERIDLRNHANRSLNSGQERRVHRGLVKRLTGADPPRSVWVEQAQHAEHLGEDSRTVAVGRVSTHGCPDAPGPCAPTSPPLTTAKKVHDHLRATTAGGRHSPGSESSPACSANTAHATIPRVELLGRRLVTDTQSDSRSSLSGDP
jgi:hypothetical protein